MQVPPNPYLGQPEWSPDGKQFAFTHNTGTGIELWIGNAITGATKKIFGFAVNAAYGQAAVWMPDSLTLVCQSVVASRGPAPVEPLVPVGPNVQESYGRQSPTPTFEDLLQNPHDEDLFEYYAASQLVLVDAASGKLSPIGKPAIYQDVTPSPDGRHLLVVSNHKPYSYLLPSRNFPKEVNVWDRTGRVEYHLASLPLQDQIPLDGVATGPRDYTWRATDPATLVWVEALDRGDSKAKAPIRDSVLLFKAPFSGKPTEIFKTEQRFAGLQFGLYQRF
jgi:dipeptidyl aminopeptidase/acylaminoacyl peptidase